MRKNITFVTGIMGNGGAERVISILANGFAKKGYNIKIIMIYGTRIDYKLDNCVEVKPIVCRSKIRLIRPIERIIKIVKILEEKDLGEVISFMVNVNIHVIIANIFSKKKLIISERNDPFQDPQSKLVRRLRDYMYKYCDCVVFQTQEAQKYFKTIIQSKSVIIPNPIKSDLPAKYEGERKDYIVSVGRLNRQKNFPMLIDAFYMLQTDYPNYELRIYGDGPLEEELLEYIERKNLHGKVKLMGFCSNIHEEILDAKVFAIASDYEGISNAMLEALAMGLPVVATDCPIGGARQYIRNKRNGLLVPVGDVNAMYMALKMLISDRELAEKISAEAMLIREELTDENIIEQWEKCIKNIKMR